MAAENFPFCRQGGIEFPNKKPRSTGPLNSVRLWWYFAHPCDGNFPMKLTSLPVRAARKAVRIAMRLVPEKKSPTLPATTLHPWMSAFKHRSPDLADLPDLIYVEPAMACNFGCKMCPVPESQKLMNGRAPS